MSRHVKIRYYLPKIVKKNTRHEPKRNDCKCAESRLHTFSHSGESCVRSFPRNCGGHIIGHLPRVTRALLCLFTTQKLINRDQHSFHCNIFVFSSLVEGNTLNPHWSRCRHILTFCTRSYLAQRRSAAGEDPNKKTDSEHNFKNPDLYQPKT